MNQETETTVESGLEAQQEAVEGKPEWDAMNGLLRQVLTVPKDEYERREAEYRESRRGKESVQG